MNFDLNLPYITENLLGIGGKIRKTFDAFIVEETSLYEPMGQGEHLYINITKEGFTTREIQEKLAKFFKLSIKSVGFAGMKDKNAITTQTFSAHLVKTDENLEDITSRIQNNLPIKVNWMKLHRNKIKIGHLLGNKFTIKITDLEISRDEALKRAKKIIEEIKKNGLPNFFGPQRFGIQGKNIEKGLKIIQGLKFNGSKWKKRLLVSSFQSYLCNLYLVRRLESGNFTRILKGDIAKKYDTGGLFEVEDVGKEQKRYENHEISFTAPIYGSKMWDVKGPSQELERKVLQEVGLNIEIFHQRGTRRLGRLLVPDISVKKCSEGLILNFSLSKGAFATIVLREIMKNG
jgi:tRNA pseudouridine13 synthase